MKKQIIVLVLIIFSFISFAGNGILYIGFFNSNVEQPKQLVANSRLMEMDVVLPLAGNKVALNTSNSKVYLNSNPNKGNNWISQTISIVGGGFNLAGINIKMSKFDLVKKTGWVDKKEWNLNADKTRNGLSIKYKF